MNKGESYTDEHEKRPGNGVLCSLALLPDAHEKRFSKSKREWQIKGEQAKGNPDKLEPNWAEEIARAVEQLRRASAEL